MISLALLVLEGCCGSPKDGASQFLAALSPVKLGMSKVEFETARTRATWDSSLGGYEEDLPPDFPYFREARYEFGSGRLSQIELKRFFAPDEGTALSETSRGLSEACRLFWGEPTKRDNFSVRFPQVG